MRHFLIAVSLLVSSPALAADIRSECKQIREMGEAHIRKFFEEKKAIEIRKKGDELGQKILQECLDAERKGIEDLDKCTDRRLKKELPPDYVFSFSEIPKPPKDAVLFAIAPAATIYNAFCKN